MEEPKISRLQGRLCCLAAAVLWSFSGFFTRLLQNDTFLGLNEPNLSPIQIAFFRSLFAGLLLAPALRREDLRFKRLMPVMMVVFAAMNALFLSAIAFGTSANAIFLQNMAPCIVYFVGVYLLGEKPDARTRNGILIAMVGVVVIVGAGLTHPKPGTGFTTMLAVGSGFCYAAVILCLRALNDQSPIYLNVLNQLGTAVCIGLAVTLVNGPAFFLDWFTMPTARQFGFLVFFGGVQMGLSYYFFAKALKALPPSEAGFITLVEPILNPLWVYLAFGETNDWPTWVGGTLILLALGWRYSR